MLNLKSLREQVYQFLREEMHSGKLLPGSTINIGEVSRQLGISKTPLRDALIHLETEGFVTILPRRGVTVNRLSLQDIKNSLEIVGALEAAAIVSVFDKFDATIIAKMEHLNSAMRSAVRHEDFDSYYQLNIDFHDIFMALSENAALRRIITPIKQRLYDFPRRSYIKEWELINCEEHARIINAIKQGDPQEAAHIMRDCHWSFSKHEKFIRQFYFNANEQIEAELAHRQRVRDNSASLRSASG
jgi:DNA-binding GntR family transcriptional regulator